MHVILASLCAVITDNYLHITNRFFLENMKLFYTLRLIYFKNKKYSIAIMKKFNYEVLTSSTFSETRMKSLMINLINFSCKMYETVKQCLIAMHI